MADAVDDLYGLPLEEFTPARDAAAREIRRAGDRDTAAQVAKLPKPSPAAWTANQVAREQPELIEAMLDAGGALREAQEAAVTGGGGRGLRDAALAERRAVDAVMTAATAHRPAGRPLSRAMADRLRTTLHAAAADESIRTALAGGRLVSEAQAGGAWPFAIEAPAGDAPKPAKAKAKAKAPAKQGGAAKQDAAAAEREAAEREALERAKREAAEQRKALEAELRELRSALRVRDRAVKAAEKAAERAARDAVEAGERLEAARQAAEDAQADAEAAEALRDEAREALGQARDDVARLEERLD